MNAKPLVILTLAGMAVAGCKAAEPTPEPTPTHGIAHTVPRKKPVPVPKPTKTVTHRVTQPPAEPAPVTSTPIYNANNCPPATAGYGIVNGQCQKIPVGNGQYSAQCVAQYGQADPYAVGTKCEPAP